MAMWIMDNDGMHQHPVFMRVILKPFKECIVISYPSKKLSVALVLSNGSYKPYSL